jgi:hypothetical protein
VDRLPLFNPGSQPERLPDNVPVDSTSQRRSVAMKTISILIITILCLCLPAFVSAQVPGIINYQGRVTVAGTNFNGTGQFQFALVDGTGATTLWSNDGSSAAGSEPTLAVSVPVSKGSYSVMLGDTTLPNMTVAIPAATFTNAIVQLRVWFNDGVTGFQQLSPDQRIASVGYAMMAANVPNGAITSNQIAAGAVQSANLANNAIGTVQLAAGAVQTSNIASGAVTEAQISASGILVPNLNADLLDGLDSSAFIQNGGTISGGTISVVKQVLHYSYGPLTYNTTVPVTYTFSICCSPNPAKSHVTLSTSYLNVSAIVTSFSSSSISFMASNPNSGFGIYVGIEIVEYY